jgi:hypothetical protein
VIVSATASIYRTPHATKQPDGSWGPPYNLKVDGGHVIVQGVGLTFHRGYRVRLSLPGRCGIALENQERAEFLGGGHFPLRISIGLFGRSWQWEGHTPRHWAADQFPPVTSQADLKRGIAEIELCDSLEAWLDSRPDDHWTKAVEWPGDMDDLGPWMLREVGWDLEGGVPVRDVSYSDYLREVYGMTEAERQADMDEYEASRS